MDIQGNRQYVQFRGKKNLRGAEKKKNMEDGGMEDIGGAGATQNRGRWD
jgi:hypothetical protein